jgi:hypothetical protein
VSRALKFIHGSNATDQNQKENNARGDAALRYMWTCPSLKSVKRVTLTVTVM